MIPKPGGGELLHSAFRIPRSALGCLASIPELLAQLATDDRMNADGL
jgi:hypothetical protein